MPRLAYCTSEEYQTILQKCPAILVPIGAMEWHDAHLPLGFDYLKMELICDKIAEKLGCFVSPPIAFGYPYNFSKHPERGPATFCPEYDPLADYVFSIGKNMVDKGFRVIYFLSGHYERIQIYMLKVITRRLEHYAASVGKKVKCYAHHEPDFTIRKGISQNAKEDYVRTEYGLDYCNGDHAGFYETSLALALAPEMVRMDKISSEYNDPQRGGKPSKEWGEKWMKMIVSKACQEIQAGLAGKDLSLSEYDY